MPDENEPTGDLETPANDLQTPDTASLFKQAIEEMQQAHKALTEQGGQILTRFDRFEAEIRRELRTFSKRLDVLSVEMNKTQAEVRDIDEWVTTLEQKPA